MAVPNLHRVVPAIAAYGPFGNAQRYWRGNDPELDIVARSATGPNILVGEAKWNGSGVERGGTSLQLGSLTVGDAAVRTLLFTPDGPADEDAGVVDAGMVLEALR